MSRSASITTIAAPSLALAKVKRWLRVYHDDEDDLVLDAINEAVCEFERRTGRLLRQATAVLTMSAFPSAADSLAVPFPVFRSLTSVQYSDANGVSQPLADVQVSPGFPACLSPQMGTEWPETESENQNAVVITWECGDVPGIDQAEITGCLKQMLNLAWHNHTPQQADRMTRAIDGIIRRWSLRDARLAGITYA